MSTPKVQPLLMPVLRTMADGNEHESKESRIRVAEELNLTDDYVKTINPKNGQSSYEIDFSWALVKLQMRKAITKKRKFWYQITEHGKVSFARGRSDLE